MGNRFRSNAFSTIHVLCSLHHGFEQWASDRWTDVPRERLTTVRRIHYMQFTPATSAMLNISADHRHRYIKGFTATMSLFGFCLVLACSITLVYVWSDRHERGDAGKTPIVRGEQEGQIEEGEAMGPTCELEKFKYPV